MPQMSALLWGILFLTFSYLLMISVIKTFFTSYTSPNPSQTNLTTYTQTYNLSWKW